MRSEETAQVKGKSQERFGDGRKHTVLGFLSLMGDDRPMIPMVIRREHPEPETAALLPTYAGQAYGQPSCNARNRIA